MSIKTLTSDMLKKDSVYYVKKFWSTEDKKFYQKNGFLTPYGYACGYMDSFSFGDYEITLCLEGIWHVRIYTKNAPRFLWECFDDTTARKDAQEFFLHLRDMVKKGADPLQLSKEKGHAERLYNARRAA